jgi:hypothetical protein
MTDHTGGIRVKPVNEVEARRAVAGLDADIMEQGLPSKEAEAITTALRLYLMGDEDAARAVLNNAFVNGTVDEIIAQFADDTLSQVNEAA